MNYSTITGNGIVHKVTLLNEPFGLSTYCYHNSPWENEHFDLSQGNNAFTMYQSKCNYGDGSRTRYCGISAHFKEWSSRVELAQWYRARLKGERSGFDVQSQQTDMTLGNIDMQVIKVHWWWSIHPDFETHGKSHLKSKTESTSGPTKWTSVQQKL